MASFARCSETEAKIFADFLFASGYWISVRTGQWEAYRFKKQSKMAEEHPSHSPYETIVINKNAQGLHSFDKAHWKVFTESQKAAAANSLREGLQSFVGQPLTGESRRKVEEAVGIAIDPAAEGGGRFVIDFHDFLKVIKAKKVTGDRMEVTLTLPLDMARDLGLVEEASDGNQP